MKLFSAETGKTIFSFFIFCCCIVLFQNCGIQTPEAPSSSSSGLLLYHNLPTVSVKACTECHEEDRKDPGHFAGQDCKGCHVAGGIWADALSINHTAPEIVAQACTACHEEDRKGPDHYPAQDCKGCHIAGGKWSEATNFDHQPVPTQCSTCHGAGQDYDALTPDHIDIGTIDCLQCHQASVDNQFASWQGGAFDHTPEIIALKNCVACHSTDRPATGAFMAQDENSNVNDSHYGKFDCYFCHGANNQFKDWDNGATSHYDAAGTKIQSCLPCHYSRKDPSPNQVGNGKIDKHKNQNTWFVPPIYDINAPGDTAGKDGKLGNCYDCHNIKRRSFDQ